MENRSDDDSDHEHHDCEERMNIDLVCTIEFHDNRAEGRESLDGRFVILKLYDVVWQFLRVPPPSDSPDPARRNHPCRCFRLVLHDAHDVNHPSCSFAIPRLNPFYANLLTPFASSPELLWNVGARLLDCCARIDSATSFREIFDASLRFSEQYAALKKLLLQEGGVDEGEGWPDLSRCVLTEAMEAAWMCKSAKVAVGEAASAAAHLLSGMIPGTNIGDEAASMESVPNMEMDVCERAKGWFRKEAAIDSGGCLLQWWTVEINEHFVYCTIKDLRQLLINEAMVEAARQVGIFVDKPLIVKLDKQLQVVAVDQQQQLELELEGSTLMRTSPRSNSMASSSSSSSCSNHLLSSFEEEYWSSSCANKLKRKEATKLGTQILVKHTVEEIVRKRRRRSSGGDGGNNHWNVFVEMMESVGRLIAGIHKLCIVCRTIILPSCDKSEETLDGGSGSGGMRSMVCGEEACRITWSAWQTAAAPDTTEPLLLPRHHFFPYYIDITPSP